MFAHHQTYRDELTVTLPSCLIMAAAGKATVLLPSDFFRFVGEVV